MKKKMMIIIIVAVIVIAILVTTVCLFVNSRKRYSQAGPLETDITISEKVVDNVAKDQLLTLTESEEQAREIANMYEIEFVSYSYGVATFHTDENIQDVLERGKKNGYPELSINYVQTIQ